jgi:hypothetical protein
MKRIRLFLIVAVIAAALTLPASAKGGFDIVTVAGPDWYGEIDITDPVLLQSLEMGQFLNLDRPIDAPAQVSRGYLITRGYLEGPVRHMFDRIVYFPGSLSFAYYLEILNGAGPMDGNWYTVSDEGEQALAAGVAAITLSGGGAIAKAGESAEVTVAKADARDIDLTKAVESQPFNFGGPDAVDLLVGAVLMGSLAGWGLREMRLRRTQSAKD